MLGVFIEGWSCRTRVSEKQVFIMSHIVQQFRYRVSWRSPGTEHRIFERVFGLGLVVLVPQPPRVLGVKECATAPGYSEPFSVRGNGGMQDFLRSAVSGLLC